MKKHIIGIPLRIGFLDNKKQYFLYSRYEEYLQRHGLAVVYLTPFSYKNLMSRLSGILLPGGGDVNPARYDGKMSCTSLSISDELDDFEFKIIDLALQKKKPIFGICRGLQLLNVYFGGTLKMVEKHFNYHEINVCEYSSMNFPSLLVNSFHHQAIDIMASNFQPLFMSDDYIIEGIIDQKKMLLAVQYHPELSDEYEIIEYFKNFFLHRAI